MEPFHFTDDNILIFLRQILVLLVCAKVLGEVFKRWGYPALAGEILTGIVLGPTLLGRALPALHNSLFPANVAQQGMLETVSWLGVLFMLLTAGFAVNITTIWRQGKTCLAIGFSGVAVPVALGALVFWWLPDTAYGTFGDRPIQVLLLATAASISAVPVIARVLHDLDVLKSDFGLTTLSAFIVNDILGWLLFAVLLALAGREAAHGGPTSRVLFDVILFSALCLIVGNRITNWAIRKLKASPLPQPATTLTFIFCLGLLCGAITQWIGVHAILGLFLAGVMVGNSADISDRTRGIISQLVHAVFVPIFFANIGLKVDFFKGFDVLTVGVFTAVALGGKFLGAYLGALWSKLPKGEALSTGIAHIPGGAMEIIIGVLALELKIISDSTFVAVVFAAVSSSLLVGPLLAWALRRDKGIAVRPLLLRNPFILELDGPTQWKVIDELTVAVSGATVGLEAAPTTQAVWEREKLMSTAVEGGLAIPHARLPGLQQSLVAFGRSSKGIDWGARDGMPVHFVFLILTPEEDPGSQVHILGNIARAMAQESLQAELMRAEDAEAAHELLSAELQKYESPVA